MSRLKPTLHHHLHHKSMSLHNNLTPSPPVAQSSQLRGVPTLISIPRDSADYYGQVNHVAVEGPITQTKWSHMPITLSAQDVNLASFPHTDSMVITIHIDRWDVTKIHIDNGSQDEILFLTAFEKMVFDRKQLKEPMASAGKELN
jgi:hypothetical protein